MAEHRPIICVAKAYRYRKQLASGKFLNSSKDLTREDMLFRIRELERYGATLDAPHKRRLDAKLTGFKSKLEDHVTAQSDRVIGKVADLGKKLDGNHKEVADQLGVCVARLTGKKARRLPGQNCLRNHKQHAAEELQVAATATAMSIENAAEELGFDATQSLEAQEAELRAKSKLLASKLKVLRNKLKVAAVPSAPVDAKPSDAALSVATHLFQVAMALQRSSAVSAPLTVTKPQSSSSSVSGVRPEQAKQAGVGLVDEIKRLRKVKARCVGSESSSGG